MLKKIIVLLSIIAIFQVTAYAENEIGVYLNGQSIATEQAPIIKNGRTLVPVRAVCEALRLGVSWDDMNKVIKISDEFTLAILEIGNDFIYINDEPFSIEAPAEIYNGYTLVPIRTVAEAFGAEVKWNNINNSIDITSNIQNATDSAEILAGISVIEDNDNETVFIENKQETDKEAAFNTEEFSFYSQPDPEWGFENEGRGYCWVCSYAMLITNLTDTRVTPYDISLYNIENGGTTGSYMTSHYGIAAKYGLEFIPALNKESKYFSSFESEKRGATYLNAETEEDVLLALSEALQNNKEGIMVRFEGYPHTIVATHSQNGMVYFNDPASENCENVEFSGTCLANNFKLTDISFVQALKSKDK